MKSILVSALAALTLASAPLVASAQVSAGTTLVGNIDQGLDSKSATVGQGFTMSGVHSTDNNIVGARVYGHVSDVQHAGQGTPGKIELAFDKLVTRSGNTYLISGRVMSADEETKNNTVKEVGGAVAGMIVGNILGKAVGTNAGGLIGAAGGYVIAKNNRQNVSIPSNTPVTLQVLQSRRQARR